jgi:isoleucyl-tRNA synthetase
MSQDYNATIHLPQTDFPMRGNLPQREPAMLEGFQEADLYHKLMKKNEGKPLFVLHDGPPYANGDIHIGTALNKILKDFIVRYKNMTGFQAPYVPGWDTHGMPIETAIQKQGVKRNTMPVPEFRDKCREFALKYLNRQRDEFKRLGGIGDWEHPYVTLKPEFEAEQVKVFGAMANKGYIYKGLKPVYWCPTDETALAEAEVEYADDPVVTIFVKFKVHDDKGKLAQYADLNNTYFVIWTTTTWTLPGNLAICLNGELEYSLVKIPTGEVLIMATDLVDSVMKESGIEGYETIVTLPGTTFEYMSAYHPFMERDSYVILGDHVTLDAGSGCVHTAPSFGADDFAVCKRYPDLFDTSMNMEVCVDSKGYLNEYAGKYAGLHVLKDAHDVIYADLVESGALLSSKKITHSYPHCWRCKKPIIFRATSQWFASVDAIKDAAVAACEEIQWKPEWGKERMISMIRDRSDWCISRQRTWGVPIPIFFCRHCDEPLVNEATIQKVSDIFRVEGSNAWWAKEASELLPEGTVCPKCGCADFRKEQDIMDVWFDSGSTWAAVVESRPELRYPADLYLEGGDQYRGWFQSSMLTSIAATGKAPYKQIVTHGWTVDGQGKAMHKSLGNAVGPDEIIKKYGADLLRLWASSADYTQDMRIDQKIMNQLSDAYRKIRNTCKYIIGNLNGFDPDQQVPFDEMMELDQWAVSKFNDLVAAARASYDAYEFHSAYRAIYNFCVVDMSNFYPDIIKDRLYCDEGYPRQSAQTAIYIILDGLTRLLAPILAFTSDEVWKAMPHDSSADQESVLFNEIPQVNPAYQFDEAKAARWAKILALKADVNKALEQVRADKTVTKAQDATVTLYLSDEAKASFPTLTADELATLFIVSKVNVAEGAGEGMTGEQFPGLTVKVELNTAPKCPRCWNHSEFIGQPGQHEELCPRCAKVVAALQP